MARLSGIQKQVLGLNRALLRAARSKPPDARRQIERFVTAEFRRHAAIDKKDHQRIELLLRRGHKQLATLRASDAFSVVTLG